MKYLALLSGLLFCGVLAQAGEKTREITFGDVFRDRVFAPVETGPLKPMHDGEHYTLSDGSRVLRYAYRTGRLEDVLFSMERLGQPGTGHIDEYEFSNDDTKLLITTGKEQLYRHSYLADYWVFDFQGDTAICLSPGGKVQLCTFSPDGESVAYVRKNNLFIYDLEPGREIQVTFDGEYNRIINGAPDWVYEEEFRFSTGYAWSPDSRYVAYYKTDESHVRQYTLYHYGDLYPERVSYKYPKAGERNSRVSIHVYDRETGQDRVMDTGPEEDHYIPRIKWTWTPGLLAISRLNRLQNRFDLILADAATGHGTMILTEKNPYYIVEPTDHKMIFLKDRRHFLFFSEVDGFLHYSLYDLAGNRVNRVTRGPWDVIEFLGMDEESRTLLYSSHEESPLQSTVYSIGLDGSGKRKISGSPGWNTAEFSPDYDYYILTHSAADTPPRITLHHRSGELIRVLESNERLKRAVTEYGLPSKEFLVITAGDNIELNAYLYKPKNFNPGREYPLMMCVYGGPESQEVRDEWGTRAWHYLLLQKGYVIACVDNRGTNGRGEAFRKSTYMQLGKLELEDQLASARYLGKLPYVDSSRTGIWGSSYGGYMASLCMTRGAGLFNLAIAISPVTSWRYYDTIYTERYMRTPQENPRGYDDYSPIHYSDRLKGEFMLAHGMVDDNVHFQHAVDFTTALVHAGKDFEMLFYPGQAHSMDWTAHLHLRREMTRFVEENL